MPDDDLTITPHAVRSRVHAAAMHQLTLLEATICDLRPTITAQEVDLDDVITLASQIGALSHMMLQWAGILIGLPMNEGDEGEDE